MQLTDWLVVEVALLLIGPTKISLTKKQKSGFNHPSVTDFFQEILARPMRSSATSVSCMGRKIPFKPV
jgi:hypothetical protein